ncbi:MAG: hypothetical protein PHP64_06215 [Actinomycetota bacterium]|nr:hypothetical protein [Actinomycetota bacterium]
MGKRNEILRALEVRHTANSSKIEAIKEVFSPYRKTAQRIAPREWLCFYTTGYFSKNISVKDIPSELSERYKETARDQVVGSLKSWVSNKKNEIVPLIIKSSLEEQVKIDLLYINKYEKWFVPGEVQTPVFKDGKKVKDEEGNIIYRTILEETRKLARLLFKQACRRHRKPSFKHINLTLDAKGGQDRKGR